MKKRLTLRFAGKAALPFFYTGLLLASLLSSTAATAQSIKKGAAAQDESVSYANTLQEALNTKIHGYESSDTAIINIKNIIALFEKSGNPVERIKLHAGIAFVLTDDDCLYSSCTAPKIYPAVIYEEDGGYNLSAMRDKKTKEPLSPSYINYYLANDLRYGDSPVFLSMLKATKPEYLTGTLVENIPEHAMVDETSLSFLRQSKGWIIALSTDRYLSHERMIVYLFRTSLETLPEEDILVVEPSRISPAAEASKPAPTLDSYFDKFVNIERDRNVFSEMIEEIVNHAHMQPYYHGADFYIVSNGRFRYDLDVKHNGRDVWIIPDKREEIKSYLLFKSHDYHPDNKLVTFYFRYPIEGVRGNAVFEKKGDKYQLKEMNVWE